MNIISCQQGSHEWFSARAGKVTASSVGDAISFLKKGDRKGVESAARAAYKARIVAETLSGAPMMDGFLSPFMKHGTEMEPFARAAYEVKFNIEVDQVGFVIHPTIERAGASPDGLIDNDVCCEFKCPKTETHLSYMLAGVLPPEYKPQVQWVMACTERTYCDFVSFDGRMPLRHQLFRHRVERDDAYIAEMEAGVLQFLSEVDEIIARLEVMNPFVDTRPAPPALDESNILADDIAYWYANTPGVTQ